MRPFSYSRAGDSETACKQIESHGNSAFLAGGTTLLDLMKIDVLSPSHLVDINRLDLTTVEKINGGVVIGALARNSDVAHHPLILEGYPLLSRALLSGASAQLRNMATVGGNLMQKTRCYYYRNASMPCNRREPGSGCPAIEGYNRIHAILGASESCVAVHPGDMAVALLALDAVIKITASGGAKREVAIDRFYRLPGDTPQIETDLKEGELITAVELPPSPFGKNCVYLKVRDRTSFAFALVSVACAYKLEDGLISEARLALGGVATVPWRARAAEEHMRGKPPNKTTFADAAQLALKDAAPLKHNKFKVELAKRTIVRALSLVGEHS